MNTLFKGMGGLGLALLLPTLGLLALPHALMQDYAREMRLFQLAAAPYLLGLSVGMVAWWAVRRTDFDVRRLSPACWLALAAFTILLPLTWPEDAGRHQYPGGIDPVLLALPFLAAGLATLDARLGRDAPAIGWPKALLGGGLVVLCVALIAFPVPSAQALLLPVLLLFSGNPSLRRMGRISVIGAGVLFLVMVVASPYRLVRLLNHGVLPYRTMFDDPYGNGYQAVHIYRTWRDMGWLGADTLVHLPEASRQLLMLSLGAQWGGLALAGVTLLVAAWFVLSRPVPAEPTANSQASRMLWWALLYFASVNVAGSALLVAPFGPGMVMVSPNAGLILLAWLVMAFRHAPTLHEPASSRWQGWWMGAWLVALGAYVAIMPARPGTTESAQVQKIASQALETALRAPNATLGGAVVLDARSGAVRAQIGRRGLHDSAEALYEVSFPPGATLYPFLVGALLDRELIQADTRLPSQPLALEKQVIADAQAMPGKLALRDVLARPSRAGAARMARMIPTEEYLGLLTALGFGRTTDIGPTREATGTLRADSGTLGQARLGMAEADSEIEVTLPQLAQAYMALLGDGHARRMVLNPYRDTHPAPRVFTRETTRIVRAMLADPGRPDAAKPGIRAGQAASITAVSPWGESRNMSVVVAFAPTDSPRYLVAAMVERRGVEPGLADNAAAPVVREILAALQGQGGQQ